MDDLRILVCGDRNWLDCSLVRFIIWRLHEKTKATKVTIIEGEAKGADTCGKYAAQAFNYSLEAYPADWARYGKGAGPMGAGPIRNTQQLRQGKPKVTIGFHDNIADSRGTIDMLNKSVKAEIPTILISHNESPDKFYDWVFWGESFPEFSLD